jgi:hypothetical protein
MLIKIIQSVFLIISLQIAAVPNLPSIFSNLNIFLVALIFICVVFDFGSGLAFGLFWAFVLDLYSPYPFGLYIISTMLTVFAVYQVFAQFLTNKSFYSLMVLMLLATVLFGMFNLAFLNAGIFIDSKDFVMMKQESLNFLYGLMWQTGLNLFTGGFLFMLLHQFSRRFNAVFIDTTKN